MAGMPCLYFSIAIVIAYSTLGSGQTLLNVAHKDHGGTCQSSSHYDNRFCTNAIGGSGEYWAPTGEGREHEWIRVYFNATYKIVQVRLQSVEYPEARMRGVEISLSDGTTKEIEMEDNSDLQHVDLNLTLASYAQHVDLHLTLASYAQVTVKTGNLSGGIGGFTNVQVIARVCDHKTWGDECKHACMCNDTNEVCNTTNGHCQSGCKQYHVGPGCINKLPTVDILTTTVLSATSIAVAWKPAGKQGNDQLTASSYVIQYRLKEAIGTWVNRSAENGDAATGSLLNYTISGLKPNKIYVFRIVPILVYNGVRYAKPSQASPETKTSCEAPLSPLIQRSWVDCDDQGRTLRIIVNWKELSMNGHRCNKYSKVEVVYFPTGTPQATKIIDSNPRDNVVNIQLEDPQNFEYGVIVRAYNDEQMSNSSLAVSAGASRNWKCQKARPTILTARPTTNIGLLVGCFVAGSAFVLLIGLIIYIVRRMVRKHSNGTRGGSPNSPGNDQSSRSEQRRAMPNMEAEKYEEIHQGPRSAGQDVGGVQETEMGEHTYEKPDPKDISMSPYQNVKEATSRTPMYESLTQ